MHSDVSESKNLLLYIINSNKQKITTFTSKKGAKAKRGEWRELGHPMQLLIFQSDMLKRNRRLQKMIFKISID